MAARTRGGAQLTRAGAVRDELVEGGRALRPLASAPASEGKRKRILLLPPKKAL